MIVGIKKKIEEKIRINDKSDFAIFIILCIISILSFLKLSDRSKTEFIYLLSILWYLFAIHSLLKIKWFSGLGMYIIYLFAYVQLGVLMNGFYSYYTSINPTTINTIMLYNIISPFFLIPFQKSFCIKNVELKELQIQDNWLLVLFMLGTIALVTFYVWVGFIPLLSFDAENARISAVAGRGFLVIIAYNCFLISMALSTKKSQMYLSLIVGGFLLLGTGFRSQLLVLILLFFLINVVGKGKKYIILGGMTLVLILGLYAIIGVYRSSIDYSVSKLYLPVLWRFFVNLDNYNILINKYPVTELKYGYTIINDLLVLLPGSQKTFMLQLKDIIDYNFSGGSMTPSVFGEGYYNWGTIGAVIWPIFNLFFVGALDKYNKKRFPGGLYYVVSFSLAGLATSSFIPPIINNYIPLIIIFDVIVYLNNRYKLYFFRR